MFAALMTSANLTVSDRSSAANRSGEVLKGAMPRLTRLTTVPWCARQHLVG